MTADTTIRRLSPDDFPQNMALGIEAFGDLPSGSVPPTQPTEPPPGRYGWGAFAGDRLVARVVVHEYQSWFGGVEVPTAGIAGVAITAERRGQGLLRAVFEGALTEAVERGEVVSTLYPTANGIYRSLGYELISSYDAVEIPTAELASVPTPVGTRLVRAEPSDLPAVRDVYDAWASAQNGPLTRTGPRFGATDAEVVADFTGITLAVDAADRVTGYASWSRGEGYDSRSTLRIRDLLATDVDAYRALWRMAGSFSSVTGRVRLSTSGHDPARLVLPTATWNVVDRHPYMLRVLDVAGALTALQLEPWSGGATTVDFAVAGDRLGVIDGGYRLALGPVPGRCERATVADGVPLFTPQGLALAYAGAQSCANLRMLGHLTGDTRHDATIDALLGGRQVHVRDYF